MNPRNLHNQLMSSFGHMDTQGDHSQILSLLVKSTTVTYLVGGIVAAFLGLTLGTGLMWNTSTTILFATALALIFGNTLSTTPLTRVEVSFSGAIQALWIANTLTTIAIAGVITVGAVLAPKALELGLSNPTFWMTTHTALAVALIIGYFLHRSLINKESIHAVVMKFRGTHTGH
jgi:hypothetical protein